LVAGAGLNIDLLVRVETETEFFVVELVVELGVGLEAVEVAVEVATGVDTSLLHAFRPRVAVMRNRIWYKLRIVVLQRNCSVKFNEDFGNSYLNSGAIVNRHGLYCYSKLTTIE
jgi:hypothetical protein